MCICSAISKSYWISIWHHSYKFYSLNPSAQWFKSLLKPTVKVVGTFWQFVDFKIWNVFFKERLWLKQVPYAQTKIKSWSKKKKKKKKKKKDRLFFTVFTIFTIFYSLLYSFIDSLTVWQAHTHVISNEKWTHWRTMAWNISTWIIIMFK